MFGLVRGDKRVNSGRMMTETTLQERKQTNDGSTAITDSKTANVISTTATENRFRDGHKPTNHYYKPSENALFQINHLQQSCQRHKSMTGRAAHLECGIDQHFVDLRQNLIAHVDIARAGGIVRLWSGSSRQTKRGNSETTERDKVQSADKTKLRWCESWGNCTRIQSCMRTGNSLPSHKYWMHAILSFHSTFYHVIQCSMIGCWYLVQEGAERGQLVGQCLSNHEFRIGKHSRQQRQRQTTRVGQTGSTTTAGQHLDVHQPVRNVGGKNMKPERKRMKKVRECLHERAIAKRHNEHRGAFKKVG